MEAVRLTYKILFSLEIIPHGYPDDVNPFIRITPDKETKKLLQDHNVLMRKQKSTHVCLIEVENTVADFGKPLIVPAEGQMLRFNVKFTDSGFLARTHLSAYDFDSNVLLLSNEVNHVSGADILLTRPISNYGSGNDYRPGYLVKSGSNYYKAIQPSNSGDPYGVGETAYWKGIPDGTYLSQADLMPRPSTAERDSHMLIEIKHSAALPADYKLLDVTSKCREVSYRIKLLM
jgi:hypothetical protein